MSLLKDEFDSLEGNMHQIHITAPQKVSRVWKGKNFQSMEGSRSRKGKRTMGKRFPEKVNSEKLLLGVPEFLCGCVKSYSNKIVIGRVRKFYWMASFTV